MNLPFFKKKSGEQLEVKAEDIDMSPLPQRMLEEKNKG